MRTKFDLSLLPERPDLSFELSFWQRGLQRLAGVDEAGRGALAGPVAAGAVILPPDPQIYHRLEGVRDSKQMAPEERQHWAAHIRQLAVGCGVGFASNAEIDLMGIVPATRLAVHRALEALPEAPQHLLVDYLQLPEIALPQTSLVKGDQRSLSIAAASVLAKTARDACLIELDSQFPGYGLAQHKGYGTAAHRRAIERLGACALHRQSFKLA